MLFTAALISAILCNSCSEASAVDDVAISYTVAFNSNGGSSVSSQSVEEDSLASEPTAPTKENYTFAGWFSDSALTQSWSFSTPITSDVTLFAAWEIHTFTVTFDVDGGSSVEAESDVEYGSTISKPADPTMDNHDFGGWYADAELTEEWDFDTDVITADTTLYAAWDIYTFTVTFDVDGGSSVEAESDVEYGSTISKPADPTMDNHDFGGWYADAELTEEWDFDTDVITADTTLYAAWEIHTFTVTFDVDGGSSIDAESDVEYGSTISKPADPTWDYHDFGGWYADAELTDEWDFDTDVITAETIIYAAWEIFTYTVKFEMGSGSAVEEQTIDHGSLASEPTESIYVGHSILAWYSDSQLSEEWSFSTPITKDVTLYATWETAKYTVNFVSNGGSTIESQTVLYNNLVSKPEDPTREGYNFNGWYSDESLSSTWQFSTQVTSDVTLYADWAIKTYTVKYKMGEGSLTLSDQYATHGSTILAPTTSSLRTGYYVSGWYTDAAMSETWSFATTITSDLTLYAEWTPYTYIITFDMDGGLPQALSQEIEYSKTIDISKITTPSKTGYTFIGWYSDAGLTLEFDLTTTAITKSMTLYAKWVSTSGGLTDMGTGNIW